MVQFSMIILNTHIPEHRSGAFVMPCNDNKMTEDNKKNMSGCSGLSDIIIVQFSVQVKHFVHNYVIFVNVAQLYLHNGVIICII